MSTLTPVWSWMPRTTLPPGPITSRIFSGLIRIVTKRGACGGSSGRGSAIASRIRESTNSRASRAWRSAVAMISRETPATLMSIWSPVMPSAVPATLKSMSP